MAGEQIHATVQSNEQDMTRTPPVDQSTTSTRTRVHASTEQLMRSPAKGGHDEFRVHIMDAILGMNGS